MAVTHCGLENCELMVFQGIGKYNIPYINGITEYNPCPYIRCDYMGKNVSSRKSDLAIDFCVDDDTFSMTWKHPEKYIEKLKGYRYVVAPDYSLYANAPVMYNMWNHYRKHWLGAYWQYHGVNIIPLIRWSLPDTFEWCFDGEPKNSVVFVSSIGVGQDYEVKKIFLDGFFTMMERLNPCKVLLLSNKTPLAEIVEYVTPVYRARPYPK